MASTARLSWWTRSGPSLSVVSRLGRSEGARRSGVSTTSAVGELLTADVTMIESYMDWHDSAVYALATAPVAPPSRIDNFSSGDLRQHFANPPELRYAGFGIGYRQEPRLEGGALVAVDGDFRYRRLERDGRLLVAIRAEESFLGRTHQWPTGEARPLDINHVALVEFTYEFCRFQKAVLGST